MRKQIEADCKERKTIEHAPLKAAAGYDMSVYAATCADYGFPDFNLIISPSTANLPYP